MSRKRALFMRIVESVYLSLAVTFLIVCLLIGVSLAAFVLLEVLRAIGEQLASG